jgi:hypothetical protein
MVTCSAGVLRIRAGCRGRCEMATQSKHSVDK